MMMTLARAGIRSSYHEKSTMRCWMATQREAGIQSAYPNDFFRTKKYLMLWPSVELFRFAETA